MCRPVATSTFVKPSSGQDPASGDPKPERALQEIQVVLLLYLCACEVDCNKYCSLLSEGLPTSN